MEDNEEKKNGYSDKLFYIFIIIAFFTILFIWLYNYLGDGADALFATPILAIIIIGIISAINHK